MKTLNNVLDSIRGWNSKENISLYWEESQREYPESGPEILEESFVRENAGIASFPDDVIELMADVAKILRSDECLSRYFWHAYWRNYLAPTMCPPNDSWPEPPSLGDNGGLFFVLVGIAIVPLVRKNHERLGFTGVVTNTVQQIARYCYDNYRRGNNGRYGIYFNQLGWLKHYTDKPYVRLGRLEFCMEPTSHDFVVYRNFKTNETMALAPDGARYSKEGYRVSIEEKKSGIWHSSLKVTSSEVTGNQIIPDGHAVQRQVTLPLKDWKQVVGKGDISLTMHIPSGGGLTLDACKDAFVQARDFFRKYFPNNPPKAIVCSSWIFNPQLTEILGYDAHLPQFQRELYMMPTPTNSTDGLWFIYLRTGKPDAATWPQETSLQRKVMNYIKEGGEWRGGGMFFLLEDVDSFGKQVYIRNL